MNKKLKPECPKCGEVDDIGIDALSNGVGLVAAGTKYLHCFTCKQITSFDKELIEIVEVEYNRRKAIRREDKINEILNE